MPEKNEIFTKVKDVFNALFIDLGIEPPDEEDLNSTIRSLILVSGLSAINDLQQARDIGTPKTLNQLKKFEKLALKLRNHIQLLCKPAREALQYTDSKPHFSSYHLENDLEVLIALGKREIEKLELGDVEVKRSRPERNQAKEVTKFALGAYKKFTGKRPTKKSKDGQAYGRELIFLEEIYESLGLNKGLQQKISPESQLKKYTEFNTEN